MAVSKFGHHYSNYVGKYIDYSNSIWILAAGALWVNAPIEIASIPVLKYGSMFFKLIPPEDSMKIFFSVGKFLIK